MDIIIVWCRLDGVDLVARQFEGGSDVHKVRHDYVVIGGSVMCRLLRPLVRARVSIVSAATSLKTASEAIAAAVAGVGGCRLVAVAVIMYLANYIEERHCGWY